MDTDRLSFPVCLVAMFEDVGFWWIWIQIVSISNIYIVGGCDVCEWGFLLHIDTACLHFPVCLGHLDVVGV